MRFEIASTVALAFAIALAATGSGCGLTKAYTGSAVDVHREEVLKEPGWIVLEDVPLVLQRGESDCGGAALTMVLQYFGDRGTLEELLAETGHSSAGPIRAGDLRELARKRGLAAFVLSGRESDLTRQLEKGRPVVVGLLKPTAGREFISHYEVVIGVHPERRMILTLDPARGYRINSWQGFESEWAPAKNLLLVVVPVAAS